MEQIYRITVIGIKKVSIYSEYIIFSMMKNIVYIFIQYTLWSSILSYQQKTEDLPILMLYFIINQFLGILYTNVSMNISDDIREGTIVNRLCKPVSLEKQYFFEALGSSIAKLGLTLVLIAGGYLLNFVIELFFGSLAFFTQSIWGVDSLKQAVMAVFSGTIFPIFLYPDWLKAIVSVLPFSFTAGKISEFYIFDTHFYPILFTQIINIVVIYSLYKLVMKIGITKLTINGG